MGEVTALQSQLYYVAAGLDACWLLVTAMGIMLMQVGFLALSVGATKVKNVKSVVFKNLLDHSVASFAWYFIGASIAFYPGNAFAGQVSVTHDGFFNARALQQYGFAITSGTIVSVRSTHPALGSNLNKLTPPRFNREASSRVASSTSTSFTPSSLPPSPTPSLPTWRGVVVTSKAWASKTTLARASSTCLAARALWWGLGCAARAWAGLGTKETAGLRTVAARTAR